MSTTSDRGWVPTGDRCLRRRPARVRATSSQPPNGRFEDASPDRRRAGPSEDLVQCLSLECRADPREGPTRSDCPRNTCFDGSETSVPAAGPLAAQVRAAPPSRMPCHGPRVEFLLEEMYPISHALDRELDTRRRDGPSLKICVHVTTPLD